MALKKGILALESGKVFEGISFGASGESFGEIVFNTSITGYQEILSDPSYCGQIIAMTYPHIGNYGINPEDMESRKVFAAGFVVREASSIVSSWRAKESIQEFLQKQNIIAIEGVDVRALTIHIREAGAMRSVISTEDVSASELVKRAKKSQGLVGRDLVKEVTCQERYIYPVGKQSAPCLDTGMNTALNPNTGFAASRDPSCGVFKKENQKNVKFKVAVLDCGCKTNILEELFIRGCEVNVFPAFSKSEDILDFKPSGIMLSNGPGDPAALKYVVDTVKKLIQHNLSSNKKIPIFGICLGHQILGLALGGQTYKLKFGHRGANHPVKDLSTGKIQITSQNHGFCVKPESIENKDIEFTHKNLYDGTLEGFRHKTLPIFCVQYHPEASPGPHDSKYLFDKFIELMENQK